MHYKLLLANFLTVLHFLIGVYVNFGWIVLEEKYLLYYIASIVIMQILWVVYDDQCILTIWENELRDLPPNDEIFIKKIIISYGIDINDHYDTFIRWLPRMTCIFAMIRYYIYIQNEVKIIKQL
jgi:hypothetical protein